MPVAELGRGALSVSERTLAIWSMHPFDISATIPPATSHNLGPVHTIVYRDHWGDQEARESVDGNTWRDLYLAADRCIRDSGDHHHVFIEALKPGQEPGELELFS